MMITAAAKPNWYDGPVEWVLGTPLQVIIIVVAALIVQIVLVRVIHKIVKRTSDRARIERLEQTRKYTRTAELSEMLMTQRTEQRAAAIGTLLTSSVSLIVWTVAVLMALEALGVNVAPLLASAGVVGVALGFGAQTMVKDYLSGIFLIIEDQFGVGDVVDLGPVIGTVEEVALRYTRLRDLSGVVWYVRNGEILRVANRSQGWTLASVDIPVAYDENLDRVRDLIESVAIDMDEDPTYDDMLLGKPTFAGVESMSGEAMVVRVTAKAVPEKQIILARTIRERIKLAFDRAGIVMPMMMRPMPGQMMPGSPPAPQPPRLD
jgi:small conductance mechanosensitive channel